MKASRIACSGLCLWLWGGTAAAAMLAPASISGTVLFNLSPPPRIDFNNFGTHALTGPGGLVQFHSAPAPFPALMAEAEVVTGYYARSSGMLSYQMEIVGPNGDVPVDALVSGYIAGSIGLGERAASLVLASLWSLENLNTGIMLVKQEGVSVVATAGSRRESFSSTRQFMLTAGHVYRISLLADAGVAAGTGLAGGGTAVIYPIFRFAAGAGDGYRFAFSEGIGNGDAATPEPSTMGLMAAGASLLSLLRRRR